MLQLLHKLVNKIYSSFNIGTLQFITLNYRANKMSITIHDAQKVVFTVAGHNEYGNPMVIAGTVPVWVSSNESVATVVLAEDGLSATVVSVAAGETTITVQVGSFAATTEVFVVAAPVAGLAIAEGVPEQK